MGVLVVEVSGVLGGEGVRRQAFIVLLMVGFWSECEGLDLLLLLSAGGKWL